MNQLYEDVLTSDRPLIGAQPVATVRPLYSLQLLRGAAALFVMAYHLSLFSEQHYKSFRWVSQVFGQGYAGVDLFFVISGFVITYTTFPAGRKRSSLAGYARKRLIRIFPIYWLLLLTFWLACRVAYGGLPQFNGQLVDWLSAFLLLPAHTPVIPVSWSLSHELFFYTLMGLLLYSRRLWFMVAFVMAGTLYQLVISQPLPPIWHFVFSPYNAEFLGGVVACLLYRAGPFRASVNWLILLVSGIWLFMGPDTTDGNQTGRFLLYGMASIGLVTALTGLETGRSIAVPVVYGKLGDASYIVYLLHPSALALFYKFVQNRPSLPFWAFISMAAGLFVAVAVVSVVIHDYVEKPLLTQLNKISAVVRTFRAPLKRWSTNLSLRSFPVIPFRTGRTPAAPTPHDGRGGQC